MTNPYTMQRVLAQIHATEVLHAAARTRRANRRRTGRDARTRIRSWWEAQLRHPRRTHPNRAHTAACTAGR